jgi:hypothetical protein
MGTVPGIQGQVRTNAEAFLGSKIIACEGVTEIGCLRAYDLYRWDDEIVRPCGALRPRISIADGGGNIKVVSPKLLQLGYKTAVVCDNDAEEQLSVEDVERVEKRWHPCVSVGQREFDGATASCRTAVAQGIPELLNCHQPKSRQRSNWQQFIDCHQEGLSRIASQNLLTTDSG